MKRFVHILSFLALGLASCTGCTKTDTTVPVCTGSNCDTSKPDAGLPPVVLGADTDASTPEPPDLPPVKFAGPDWEFSTPHGWNIIEVEDDLNPEITIANMEERNLIMLIKDPAQGSTPEHVFNLVRGFTQDGVAVHSTVQTELNGKKFLLLDTSSEGARMWFWITVQNNVAYSLSCGGAEDEDHHEGICKEVAASLKIK